MIDWNEGIGVKRIVSNCFKGKAHKHMCNQADSRFLLLGI